MATPDFDGDLDYAPLWAGESCSVVNEIKPAGEIVRELVRDAEAALADADRLSPAGDVPRVDTVG
jgi:nitronate monooxygenase/enoyl-[acyl-carrier protein] reductase II